MLWPRLPLEWVLTNQMFGSLFTMGVSTGVNVWFQKFLLNGALIQIFSNLTDCFQNRNKIGMSDIRKLFTCLHVWSFHASEKIVPLYNQLV